MTSSFVILPTFGTPYILGPPIDKNNHKEIVKRLQQAVGGFFQEWPKNTKTKKTVVIHPSFVENTLRWNLAHTLMNDKSVKIYVNENGMEKCCVNTAVIAAPELRVGGCPHLWGDVCLVIPTRTLAEYIDVEALELVDECWKDGEIIPFEPDDEEEINKKKEECRLAGTDYIESTGLIYKKPL